MVEYIDREAAKKKHCEICLEKSICYRDKTCDELKAFDLIPAADVVEVVRCKDCKHADYGTDEEGNRFLKCIGSGRCYGGTQPYFFCADGVRKE